MFVQNMMENDERSDLMKEYLLDGLQTAYDEVQVDAKYHFLYHFLKKNISYKQYKHKKLHM